MPDLFPNRRKRQRSTSQRNLNAAQRSLKVMRDRGYVAEVCERWCAFGSKGGYRKDLFGFADILAYGNFATIAVQTTSRQQMSAHLRMYRREEELRKRILAWLEFGCRLFQLHGWEAVERPTKAGKTVRRWELTEKIVLPCDL